MIFYGPPIPAELRRAVPQPQRRGGPGGPPWQKGGQHRQDGPRRPDRGSDQPRGPRPDRPSRDQEDRRDRPAAAAKPPEPRGPDPDSPFAILAQLKLR
jgi:ATP-dependent RNA helicase SUPV3L1/SUV3